MQDSFGALSQCNVFIMNIFITCIIIIIIIHVTMTIQSKSITFDVLFVPISHFVEHKNVNITWRFVRQNVFGFSCGGLHPICCQGNFLNILLYNLTIFYLIGKRCRTKAQTVSGWMFTSPNPARITYEVSFWIKLQTFIEIDRYRWKSRGPDNY